MRGAHRESNHRVFRRACTQCAEKACTERAAKTAWIARRASTWRTWRKRAWTVQRVCMERAGKTLRGIRERALGVLSERAWSVQRARVCKESLCRACTERVVRACRECEKRAYVKLARGHARSVQSEHPHSICAGHAWSTQRERAWSTQRGSKEHEERACVQCLQGPRMEHVKRACTKHAAKTVHGACTSARGARTQHAERGHMHPVCARAPCPPAAAHRPMHTGARRCTERGDMLARELAQARTHAGSLNGGLPPPPSSPAAPSPKRGLEPPARALPHRRAWIFCENPPVLGHHRHLSPRPSREIGLG
ncbi:uncharacterized protein LOC115344970 [Aquila chrysaetos chrysaetos]|uniref:uncharacterized protein LOC115344970 n=1 Tax=Aquila chrysaetos chrysaetos TaxID=223781 RepID=UPI0011772351|nr:uncharacterized protein LOC115344970 [Aquila chrysaetos chrysaetos]